jgi:calmodulin
MANLTSNQEKKLRDAFNLFDSSMLKITLFVLFICSSNIIVDRSGQLSRKELKNVLKALYIKVNDKELQALLNQMDTNGNGNIDFNEFKAVMAKNFFGRHSQKDLEAAFKKYDSDGNGFLTIDELQSAMSSMGRQMTRNEILSMIQSLDLNRDGKISFDEFIKLFN